MGKKLLYFLSFFLLCMELMAQSLEAGKTLAQSHCASCHSFPAPDLLPKQIWKKHVLPQMAAFMGVKAAQDSLGIWENKTAEEIQILKELEIYPETSRISDADFLSIVAYYETEAPVHLPSQPIKKKPGILKGFTGKKLFIEGIQSPQTSMVAINEERGELFISDAAKGELYVKDINDQLFTLPPIGSPAVHFSQKAPNHYSFLTIGSIAPSDLSQGELYEMDLNTNSWEKILSDLPRPVFGIWEDLELDNNSDLILCNYGNFGGNISIYPDGNLKSAPILLGNSGARKLEVIDMNEDGLPDIVALFCQGNERISVFYNQGNGTFDFEKILLRFSPVMGSSYMETHDFNQDGLPDFLVSNGDNWDYSSVLKPYHGFRIYINQGNNVWEQKWFYPQYGAARAMALDYDGDGDLDIATLAFYDDLDDPQNQFLLFQNQGNLQFEPSFIPEAAQGKWITMDTGDLDGDGDLDIVLGAYNHNVLEYSKLVMRGVQEIPSVLIIENNQY